MNLSDITDDQVIREAYGHGEPEVVRLLAENQNVHVARLDLIHARVCETAEYSRNGKDRAMKLANRLDTRRHEVLAAIAMRGAS